MNKQFDFGVIRPMYYFFGVSAFLGIVFSFISENEQSHFLYHLALWLLQTVGPVFVLVYCHVLLHKSTFFDKLNPWLKLSISGVVGAFIFSPLALGLDFLWNNDSMPNEASLMFLLWIDECVAVMPPITISWIAINAPWLLGFTFSPTLHSSHTDMLDDTVAPIEIITQRKASILQTSAHEENNTLRYPFYALLTQPIDGDLIYLQSELHYLLVVTTLGRELILYNLKDAIAEIEANTGVQSHRSYWVSYQYISHFRKKGRQGELTMSNGDCVPVSRNNLEKLQRLS
jgi:hypothetical protein